MYVVGTVHIGCIIHFVNYLLQDVRQTWGQHPMEYGPMLPWAPELEEVSMLVWADNFFFLGADIGALQSRVTSVVERFCRAGLEFSPGSLEMLCNDHFPDGPVHTTPGGAAFTRVPKLVCLGVSLDSKATSESQIQYRIDQARSTWVRHRSLLRNPHIPTTDRYRLLQATVGASVLYGAGSWVPSAHTRSALEQAEWRFLRWMTRTSKDPSEEWLAFYRRRHREAKTFRTGEAPSFWHRAIELSFTWYGHIARHATSPAGRSQRWRNLGWWRAVQCVRGARDSEGRHPTRGWQRGLERTLEQSLGGDFHALATAKDRWNEKRAFFVRQCVAAFGGALPTPPPAAKRARGGARV